MRTQTYARKLCQIFNYASTTLMHDVAEELASSPTFRSFLTFNNFLFSTMMQVNVIPLLKDFRSSISIASVVTPAVFGSHSMLLIFYCLVSYLGCLVVGSVVQDGTPIQQNFITSLPMAIYSVVLLRIILVVTLVKTRCSQDSRRLPLSHTKSSQSQRQWLNFEID